MGFVIFQRKVIAKDVTAFSGVCKSTNTILCSVKPLYLCPVTYHGLNSSTGLWKGLMNSKKISLRCVRVCVRVCCFGCVDVTLLAKWVDVHMDIFIKTAPLFSIHSQLYLFTVTLMKVEQHLVIVHSLVKPQ